MCHLEARPALQLKFLSQNQTMADSDQQDFLVVAGQEPAEQQISARCKLPHQKGRFSRITLFMIFDRMMSHWLLPLAVQE